MHTRNRREGNMQREVLKRLKKQSYLTEGKTCLSIKIVFILKMSGNSKNVNALKIRR